jgi:hypothetical protein
MKTGKLQTLYTVRDKITGKYLVRNRELHPKTLTPNFDIRTVYLCGLAGEAWWHSTGCRIGGVDLEVVSLELSEVQNAI